MDDYDDFWDEIRDARNQEAMEWLGLVQEPAKSWGSGRRRIQSFEDLNVWRSARQLRKELTLFARSLPQGERYRLVDQIIRAARSVTANIAEGYGRFSFKDNIHFCVQARGSLYELMDHLITCNDEGFIEEEAFRDYKGKCMDSIRLLNGYIRFLQKQQG